MALKVAIIPARAGSKRLKNKNIKELGRKPLVAWTIEAALKAEMFDLVIVSTDSKIIADIAEKAGAFVPYLRPAELSSDTATTNDVVTHVVKWVEDNIESVSQITILQPTSPFRDENDIREALKYYENKLATSVISVCELEHPLQYCNQLSDNMSMQGFISIKDNKRSQELGKSYRLNGAMYVFSREFVGRLSDIYSEGSYAYVMSKEKSIDIDDEFDFKMAEFILHECIMDKNKA